MINMFIGRAHVLEWLTSIKYSSLVVINELQNTIHKRLERMMLADAILHAIGYIYRTFLSHNCVHVEHSPV